MLHQQGSFDQIWSSVWPCFPARSRCAATVARSRCAVKVARPQVRGTAQTNRYWRNFPCFGGGHIGAMGILGQCAYWSNVHTGAKSAAAEAPSQHCGSEEIDAAQLQSQRNYRHSEITVTGSLFVLFFSESAAPCRSACHPPIQLLPKCWLFALRARATEG